MRHKYNGFFNDNQIESTKKILRKKIFFLLLCVDEKTKEDYKNVDINKSFNDILYLIGGMNELLFYPPELIIVMSLLERANIEYNNPDFNFSIYRKLILDAGSEVERIKDGD